MKQQVYEEALKRIVAVIEETGPTMTHNMIGDRKKATRALGEIAKTAREALSK